MSYHLEFFINNVGNIKNIFKLTHPLLRKKKKKQKKTCLRFPYKQVKAHERIFTP